MNRKRSWIFVGISLGLFAASWGVYDGLYQSHVAESESQRAVLVSRGLTLLDALHAGISAQGRMGQCRRDRLAIVFEALAESSGVYALVLRDPNGKIVATGGESGDVPEGIGSGQYWSHGRLTVGRRIDFLADGNKFGEGRRQGHRGDPEAAELLKGIYELSAVLDTAEVDATIRRDRNRTLVYAGTAFAALLLAATALLLMLRRSEMSGELEHERERTQRQERAAKLGAGLAHETKNPLGIVRGLAQAIGDCTALGCPNRMRVKQLVDEVDRVIGGINDFLAVSRPPAATPTRVDLDKFFGEFLPLVQMDAAAAGTSVDYVPCGLVVMADATLLRRALLNLILNAFRASSPGQKVAVETKRDGKRLALVVADEGCGMTPEVLARVTEPYFTQFVGGSGLGLYLVEQIASAHGWKLAIASTEGHGTHAALEKIVIVEAT